MEVETGDLIEHCGGRHIDRNICRKTFKDLGKPRNPVFKQQDLLGQKIATRTMRGGEHPEHHRALGYEPPFASGQVPLADRPEFGDPRVVRVFDANRRHYCGTATVTSATMRPAAIS